MACSTDDKSRSHFTDADFERLLEQVAVGWNNNDAEHAANAFSENAIYSEPPNKQLYIGRMNIYEFFGGAEGRDYKMNMVWHHTSYNELDSVGAGEFSFSWPGGQVHGVVSIKVSDGLISNWREYYYESDVIWEEFVSENPF